MPRLPDFTSYGQRPSTNVNRLDQPDTSGIELADAVTRAADRFTQVMQEKQDKTDRLQYSLAKQELLLEDVRARESFREDQDYETYSDRYRERMNQARDRILNDFGIAADDRVIFSAEADLLIERGNVGVADQSQVMKRDVNRAALNRALTNVEEIFLLEGDPNVAAETLSSVNEGIDAALNDQVITAQEAEEYRQRYTQSLATKRLNRMDTPDLVESLRRTIRVREAEGPITPEQIADGKGSGSVADFLPTSVASEMLEIAENTMKGEEVMGTVFDIVDRSAALFPITGEKTAAEAIGQRREYALSQLDRNDPLYAEKRDALNRELAERSGQDEALFVAGQQDLFKELAEQIKGGASYGELAQKEVNLLSTQNQQRLSAYSAQMKNNEGFAEATDSSYYYKVMRETSDAELLSMDLDNPMVKSQMTRPDWEILVSKQSQIEAARAKGSGGNSLYKGDSADEVLENMLIGSGMFKKRSERSKLDEQRFRQIDLAVDKALTRQSANKGGPLTPQEIRETTARIISNTVYTNRPFFGEPDEMPAAIVNPNDPGDAYVPIDKLRGMTMPDPTSALGVMMDGAGKPMTVEQYLRNLYPEMSEKEIEQQGALLLSTGYE